MRHHVLLKPIVLYPSSRSGRLRGHGTVHGSSDGLRGGAPGGSASRCVDTGDGGNHGGPVAGHSFDSFADGRGRNGFHRRDPFHADLGRRGDRLAHRFHLLLVAGPALWQFCTGALAAARKSRLWWRAGARSLRTGAPFAVLIGHFVGPLRAVVFLIAGMSTMTFLRFQLVNVVGAIDLVLRHSQVRRAWRQPRRMVLALPQFLNSFLASKAQPGETSPAFARP